MDVCSRITDGSHFSPKTKDKGFPYITVKDISDSGEIDIKNCKKISENDFKELIKSNCQPDDGDVLLSKDGTVGKTALVNNNEIFVVLSSLAILSPKPSIVHSKFLYLFLNSPEFQEKAISSKTGAAIKRIVLKNIKEYKIPLPPLSEQNRIISKLDSLFSRIDKSITLLEGNIKYTKALMESVMEEVFLYLSLNYKSVELSNCTNFKNGFAFKSTEFNDSGIGLQVIRIGNVLNLKKNPVFIGEKKEYESARLKRDDIVISMTGTRTKKDYLFVSLIKENCFYLNQRVGSISPKSNTISEFILYFLKSNLFRGKIFEFETGTVNQGNISGKDIMNCKLPLPSIEIQKIVAGKLSNIEINTNGIISAQQSKLAHLKALKSSILDRAFKGEL